MQAWTNASVLVHCFCALSDPRREVLMFLGLCARQHKDSGSRQGMKLSGPWGEVDGQAASSWPPRVPHGRCAAGLGRSITRGRKGICKAAPALAPCTPSTVATMTNSTPLAPSVAPCGCGCISCGPKCSLHRPKTPPSCQVVVAFLPLPGCPCCRRFPAPNLEILFTPQRHP